VKVCCLRLQHVGLGTLNLRSVIIFVPLLFFFPHPHLPQPLLSSAGLLPVSHLHPESLHNIHRTPESKPFLTSRLQPASAACFLRRHCSWHAGVNPHPLRRSSPQIPLPRHSSCYISLIRISHIQTRARCPQNAKPPMVSLCSVSPRPKLVCLPLHSVGRSSRASKRATPVPDVTEISSSDEYSDPEDEPVDNNLKGTV
jgi:hypothetical protein